MNISQFFAQGAFPTVAALSLYFLLTYEGDDVALVLAFVLLSIVGFAITVEVAARRIVELSN